MFATFNSSMGSDSPSPKEASAARPLRRTQVARACSWCRLNRIKCDAKVPCKNCENRGRECSNSNDQDKPLSKTLPLANREIEALRAKVTSLETQLKEKPDQQSPLLGTQLPSSFTLSPFQSPQSPSSFTSSPFQSPQPAIPNPSPASSPPDSAMPSSASTAGGVKIWDLAKDPYRLPASQAGLSALYSSSNAATRTQIYLADALQTSPPHLPVQPATSMRLRFHDVDEQPIRVQENNLLDLFWQSYHSLHPIVDIQEFQEYHDTLWADRTFTQFGGCGRRQSALLDIVLALCMQHGSVQLPDQSPYSRSAPEDSCISGAWLYHRCQSAIAGSSEDHSLMMLRCHIYSTIYLMNAGQTTAAYETLEIAARTARFMGIHHEQYKTSRQSQISILRRIWWNMVLLDTRISLELDRPYLLDISNGTIAPPSDDSQEADSAGVGLFSVPKGLNYLSCNTHCIHLALLTRATHTALQSKSAELMAMHTTSSIHANPTSLESCALFLLPRMKHLQSWPKSVPEALRHSRQGKAEAFSTSKSPLELDVYAPLWQQRQRIYLELFYHNIMTSLYRPFVRFSLSVNSGTKDHATPISNGHGVLALNHAATTTHIIGQLLTETELINNWIDAYQFQWDATVTLLAFAAAHPVCAFTSLAREAISTAISNFDHFNRHGIRSAQSAGRIAGQTHSEIDTLVQKLRGGLLVSSPGDPSSRQSISSLSLDTNSTMELYMQNVGPSPSITHNSIFPDNLPALNQQPDVYSTQKPTDSEVNSMAVDTGTQLYPTLELNDIFTMNTAECMSFSAEDFSALQSQPIMPSMNDTSLNDMRWT